MVGFIKKFSTIVAKVGDIIAIIAILGEAVDLISSKLDERTKNATSDETKSETND